MWWAGNQSITSEQFEALYQDFLKAAEGMTLFAQDLYGGADPSFRIKTRVFTELAWHSLFIRTPPSAPRCWRSASFVPELTIIDLPSFRADPPSRRALGERRGHRFRPQDRPLIVGLIMRRMNSVFTTLNYYLPEKRDADARPGDVGPAGETAIFFGLSGTGKQPLLCSTWPRQCLNRR